MGLWTILARFLRVFFACGLVGFRSLGFVVWFVGTFIQSGGHNKILMEYIYLLAERPLKYHKNPFLLVAVDIFEF